MSHAAPPAGCLVHVPQRLLAAGKMHLGLHGMAGLQARALLTCQCCCAAGVPCIGVPVQLPTWPAQTMQLPAAPALPAAMLAALLAAGVAGPPQGLRLKLDSLEGDLRWGAPARVGWCCDAVPCCQVRASRRPACGIP